MRPVAAAAGTEQTAVEDAAVTPMPENECSAGFFKSILTRFLTMLKLLCMMISGKTEPTAQDGRDVRLIVDGQTDKARYAGCRGGKAYYVPEPSDFRENQAYYPLRAAREGIAVAATCPGWKASDRSREPLCRMMDFVDYRQYHTCAPIALVEAYWVT